MDLNIASTEQLDAYRATVAKTMNIDPLMLDFIWMNDPETGLRNRVLYAKRGAAEVLRHELKVSVVALDMLPEKGDGLVSFKATGTIPSGRQEIAVGSAYIEGLRGDKKAHGTMTAQTRAVRRLTLQFVTGGVLDETEVQFQSDLQIVPAASSAALAGSPMVIPIQPLTAPTSAPGRDVTPSPAPEVPPQTPEEFSAAQQALRDETKAQLLAEKPAEPVAKVKRTRKARNTVSIASPGQTEMPVGHIDAQGKVSQPPASLEPSSNPTTRLVEHQIDLPKILAQPNDPVLTPGTALVPLPVKVVVEKAQPVPAQAPVAPPSMPLSIAMTYQPVPSAAAALSPEKATEFKNRLRVYANDVLPKGGMLPTESIGGVTMKLRRFASVQTGAADTTTLSLAQWEDLFDFLDSYTQKNGPAGLVQYIDKAIGATK